MSRAAPMMPSPPGPESDPVEEQVDPAAGVDETAPATGEAPPDLMGGISKGLAPQDEEITVDDMIASPSREQVPYQEALNGLANGDLAGLEGIRFSRGRGTGRAIASFIDEHGEPQSMFVPDSVWFAAVTRRGRAREAQMMMAQQAQQDEATRQRLRQLMAVSRTPSTIAGLVDALAARNPEKALSMALDFEQKRATGKPVVGEGMKMTLEILDEDRKSRLVTYTGQMSKLNMRAERARMLLNRDDIPDDVRREAAQDVFDVATVRSLQYGAERAMRTGMMPVGFISYAMESDQNWNQDGGPLERVMALAAKEGRGWPVVPRPNRPEAIPAYINAMNGWVKSILGWPQGFAATPPERAVLAAHLARNDPRFEVQMLAHQQMMGDAMMMQQAGQAGAQQQPRGQGAAPQQAPAQAPAPSTKPEGTKRQGKAPSVAGQLFEGGKLKVKNPADPTDAEIDAISLAISRQGVKDPEQIAALIEEYLAMAAKESQHKTSRKEKNAAGAAGDR